MAAEDAGGWSATLALRPIAGTLPPDLAWVLLTDADRRRAGYRLLILGDTHQQLRAALIAAVDTDAHLARRAAADAIPHRPRRHRHGAAGRARTCSTWCST